MTTECDVRKAPPNEVHPVMACTEEAVGRLAHQYGLILSVCSWHREEILKARPDEWSDYPRS